MIEQINKSNDETENKTELKIIKNLTLEFKPNPNIRTTFILLIFFLYGSMYCSYNSNIN